MPTRLKTLLSEASLRLSDVLPSRFELVYSSGGTGGPYDNEDAAKKAAERLLQGGSDRWVAVIDAKDVNDLTKAKALWTLKRGGRWEKGPSPLPNVRPMDHFEATPGHAHAVVEYVNMGDVWRKLQREFKDWPLGELKDAASSVSPSMSVEARKVQVRYQELVKEYSKEESTQGSGRGARVIAEATKLLSRKVLYAALKEMFATGMYRFRLPDTYQQLRNEVFGSQAFIFFDWEDVEEKSKGEAELKKRGFKIDRYDEPRTSSIRVSYFKGWHWDESVQDSGHGQRLTEAKSFTTKRDITSKKGGTIPKGAKVTLSWKDLDGKDRAHMTRVVDDAGTSVLVSTESLPDKVSGVTAVPSVRTMEKWSDDGIAKSVLGAKVELDGWDDEGSPSWALAMGLV